MEHFKLKLDRTSIEHRRPSINVRSFLPSTKCVTKEAISPSANSESFRAKTRNTPTYFPILTTFNLVANGVHFYVKWRKARHFDARTVDSFVLKRDWGSPCWPWMTRMVSKIPQMFILSISNCEWHCPVKSTPESEICQSMPRFSRYTRSTSGVRKTASATQMDVRT